MICQWEYSQLTAAIGCTNASNGDQVFFSEENPRIGFIPSIELTGMVFDTTKFQPQPQKVTTQNGLTFSKGATFYYSPFIFVGKGVFSHKDMYAAS